MEIKKVAIFGGTFNPVHNEHIALAEAAIRELNLDKLIVMPTYKSPHKDEICVSAEDRFNMLKIAFKDIEKVEVSNYEIENKGTSYTYITTNYFKNLYNAELYFICGYDMLENFKTWKFPEKILNDCKLAVFNREDCLTDYTKEKEYFLTKFNKSFINLSYIGKKDSSTKIRIYNELKLDISEFTNRSICEYIKNHNLYTSNIYDDFIIKNLPLKRIIHTANVICTALSKSKELSLDENKVKISATLHDCAKYLDYKNYNNFILEKNVPKPVIHAFLGAYIAENILNISDNDILNAIRFHTSGRANMSELEKLIFVADMIEEGRDYEGVDNLRKYFKTDFEKCFIECLKEEMKHLKAQFTDDNLIYYQTVNAYKYYIEGKN